MRAEDRLGANELSRRSGGGAIRIILVIAIVSINSHVTYIVRAGRDVAVVVDRHLFGAVYHQLVLFQVDFII
jgi:hypothetical protein